MLTEYDINQMSIRDQEGDKDKYIIRAYFDPELVS